MTKVISAGISPKEVLTKIDSECRDVHRSLRLIDSAVQADEKHVCDGCNVSDALVSKDLLDSSCKPAIKRSRST